MTDVSTPDEGQGTSAMDSPETGSSEPTDTAAQVPSLYTVNRTQDGALVRAQLALSEAQSECATLNAQSRLQVGLTRPVYDDRGGLVRAAQPIMASMFQGQVARYEVRSADGIVVSS